MRHCLFILFLICGCGKKTDHQPVPQQERTGVISVVAVNYPLRYFAERIGGELVNVRLPVPAGEDPADWRPEKGELRGFVEKVRAAELILLNGAGYAKWIKAGEWREAQLVHTSGAIRDSLIRIGKEEGIRHKHGGREHSHAGLAYTIWLDPVLAVKQAETVAEALSRVRPGKAKVFAENLELLRKDLEGLGLPTVKQPLIASHPVYQYLERRMNLNLKSVHWEPGTVPDEEGWQALKTMLEEHKAKVMIWEGEPMAETAKRLKELGMEPVVFAPLGNAPAEGDYLSAMRENLTRLKAATGE
tara:strand:- start:520 stop:1425 length:906 start_codon:yes stop_codon:yes gene_type:complete